MSATKDRKHSVPPNKIPRCDQYVWIVKPTEENRGWGHSCRERATHTVTFVETGPVRQIFRQPAHPYTRGLLASMPGGAPGQRLRAIEGSVPMLGALPPGCAFNPRCPDRFEPCTSAPPPDYAAGPSQTAKCYLHDPQLTAHNRPSAIPNSDAAR